MKFKPGDMVICKNFAGIKSDSVLQRNRVYKVKASYGMGDCILIDLDINEMPSNGKGWLETRFVHAYSNTAVNITKPTKPIITSEEVTFK